MKKLFPIVGVCILLSVLWLILREKSEVSRVNNEVSLPSVVSESGNIRVSSPSANSVVVSPLIVAGEARVFESQFSIRLRDEDGSVLIEKPAMAQSPDVGAFGPFSTSLSFLAPKGESGTLEVFDYSAKDGAEIDMVKIPVVFKK